MSSFAEKIQGYLSEGMATVATLLKAVLLSRRPFPKGNPKQKPLVIMGNGPSLRNTIDEGGGWLEGKDLMAVNFFANSPDFVKLKPGRYILADGHFFNGMATDKNVERLWAGILSADWPMTLYVPWKYARQAWNLAGNHPHVEVKVFNLTPGEGFVSVCDLLYSSGLAMPRPRNVMVPAIMNGIREGYGEIFLTGADHTWTKTLDVDNENFVVSVQPHFYKDNEEEHKRVRSAYAGLHLHDVLGSMTVAFRSYWRIRGYAEKKGVKIINATPGSMIDAFPRMASQPPAAT